MTSSVPINDNSDLIGREAESELLDAFIDGLQDTGGALIVRGEAGFGKSALLQQRPRFAAVTLPWCRAVRNCEHHPADAPAGD